MEKKLFIGVLYITIFVTFCFILLTSYLQYRLNNIVNTKYVAQDINNNISINNTTITPTEIPLIWNTYIDRDNGFSIEYPTNRTVSEHVTNGYHMVDFFNGCMQITSGTPQQIARIEDIKIFPFSYIEELKDLDKDESITIIVDTWDLGGNKKFNLSNTYVKQNSHIIGKMPWYTFSVFSNYENHGTLNQYYLEHNGLIFFISSLSGGPCWKKEPIKMLDSFRFTDN